MTTDNNQPPVSTEPGEDHSATLDAKLALVALTAGLIAWHVRRPDIRLLDGAIFIVSLVIVSLGVLLAH